MSARFILGRAGSGKTYQCLAEIRSQIHQDPVGSPLIYLVPEQMTFHSEYELLTTPSIQGMMRAQVYSFSRLAWRVLQEVGGLSRHHLNGVGLHMMIRNIIERRKEELHVYQKISEETGFIEQVETMVTECKQHFLSAADLFQKYEQLNDGQAETRDQVVLMDKLHDLSIIMSEVEQYLLQHYLSSEDYLPLLEEKIKDSTYIHQAQIWVDGFYSFTPQELQVLQALMIYSERVSISLSVDPADVDQPPREIDLFYPTKRTYQQIRRMTAEEKIDWETPLVLQGVSMRSGNQPSLAHLERFYHHRPVPVYDQECSVQMAAAVNRRAEVEGVAREMVERVRDHGYRWRDMAIMVRNMEQYDDLLHTLLTDYEIPFFMDQKRSMLHHPLIELIRSSLDVLEQNWRYEAVFRCVKTDLLFPLDGEGERKQLREELDQVENEVLAYGHQGEELANQLGEIATPLLDFGHQFRQSATAREMCEALFLYLQAIDIPRKIEHMRDRAAAEGRLTEAREHDQVWDAVLDLLDQMVEMMGEQPVSKSLFVKMIESGLDSMRFALVPPAMDQVVVASLDRSRLAHVKYTFILGVNDGVLPARPQEDGLLTEAEREWLIEEGVGMAPSSRELLAEEPFLIYNALSSPSERLWISYPLADEEGKALLPSSLIQQLKEMFPHIKERLITAEPQDQEDRVLTYVNRPQRTLSDLAGQLRQWQKGYPLSDVWWDVYNWLIRDVEWGDASRSLLSSLFYRNREPALPAKTSRALYGEHLQVSVSRMERYQSCPFSQFVSHGLRLKERTIFRLEAPDIGLLFHDALREMSERLWQEERDWGALSAIECQDLADIIVDELVPRVQNRILLSTNRLHYIARKLKQVVGRASIALSRQAKQSGFSPLGLELAFGGDAPLPSIHFELDNGCRLELVGRIDRVDQAEGEQGLLLRIIDYKSSQTELNMNEVYYGLALQMLIYLDVLITGAEEWLGQEALPAGVLYFHVHNPLIQSNRRLPTDTIEQELFKKFKMKGLVLAEQEAAQLMDTELVRQYSDVIPVALKKDGGFYSNSSVASREEFDALRRYVRQLIEKSGTELTNGRIDIAPYQLKQKKACDFCSYHSICQFDHYLDENEYRTLGSGSKQIWMQKVIEEGGGVDHNDT